MKQQNTNSNPFNDDNHDDYSVLNFLLEHVRGISPSSFSPHYALADDDLENNV